MKSHHTSKLVFILSVIVIGFWWLGQVIDYYHFHIVGVIFEILWLPMLVSLFVLPVISLVFLLKEKFTVKSFYLYSLLILLATLLVMFFK